MIHKLEPEVQTYVLFFFIYKIGVVYIFYGSNWICKTNSNQTTSFTSLGGFDLYLNIFFYQTGVN